MENELPAEVVSFIPLNVLKQSTFVPWHMDLRRKQELTEILDCCHHGPFQHLDTGTSLTFPNSKLAKCSFCIKKGWNAVHLGSDNKNSPIRIKSFSDQYVCLFVLFCFKRAIS